MKRFKDLVQGDIIYKILSDKAVYKLTLRKTPNVIAGENLYLQTDMGNVDVYCTELCHTSYKADYHMLSFQEYTVIIGGTENSIKIGPKFCKSWRDISENAVLFLKNTIDGSIREIRPKEVLKSDDYFLINIQELEDTVIINRKDAGEVIKWGNYYISYKLDNIVSYIEDDIRFYENQIQLLEEETIKLQYLLDTYENNNS